MRISEMAAGDSIVCSKCANIVFLTERMKKIQTRICPKCLSADAVNWARNNREKKRATNNAYHSRISDKRAAKTASYRANNPARKAAHQAVQTAKRNGRLIQEPCGVCGSGKSHAHHDDYSMPLDVSWLCHQHHMERHHMLEARKK